MLEKLFFISLVLNVTGLFRFVAPQLGVSIGDISLGLLVFNILYLLAKGRCSLRLLRLDGFEATLLVLLIWPLLTVVYAPTFELREIGLLLFYFSLFLGAAVYTLVNGMQAMYTVMATSLGITVFGLVLSLLAPGYFVGVAQLAASRTEYMGRPFGFYMQPNMLAMGMTFMFIGWFSLWKRKESLLEVPALLAFLLVMLLTGSRTGTLVALMTVGLILAHGSTKRIHRTKHVMKLCLFAACLVLGALGTSLYLSQIGRSVTRSEDDLIDRMESLLNLKFNSEGGVKEDVSVQNRVDIQTLYVSLIKQKPILGHGFGADYHYQLFGPTFLAAHSEAVTSAMECGVLFPVAFGLMIFRLYVKRSRRGVEEALQTNAITQFILATLFLFAIANIFDDRCFYVLLGTFSAALYCPRLLLACDENTGRMTISRPVGHSKKPILRAGELSASETSIGN